MTEPKPDTLHFTRTSDGVQIALLKPPIYRRSRTSLGLAILASVILAAFFSCVPMVLINLYGGRAAMTLLLPVMGLSVGGVFIYGEINPYRETAVLEVGDGYLTFVHSGSDTPRQWTVGELQTVRAWCLGKLWELRVELKSGITHRLLKGRSRRELQLAASLLREALGRGKAPPIPPPAAAIAFIEGGECQICGAGMTDHVVFCAKCRTPHHEECWTYNGACSTYGCREIRWTRTA